MSHRLTSHPLFDSFSSHNIGEDVQYKLTRAAVLTALMHSPRVLDVFTRWEKETGLDALTEQVVQAGDALAKALHLPGRASLNQPDTIDLSTLSAQTQRRLDESETARAHFGQGLKSVGSLIGQDAIKVAQDLKLPWPWVSQGLLHGLMLRVGARAAGVEFNVQLAVEPAPVALVIDPTISNKDLIAMKQAAQRPNGRTPKGEALERYAGWFVRLVVDGAKLNQLAKEYCEKVHSATNPNGHTWREDRKTITDSIEIVKLILARTSFTT